MLMFKKTKNMGFHPKRKMVNYPNLKKINDVESNFLGLIINPNLKWQSHIDHI